MQANKSMTDMLFSQPEQEMEFMPIVPLGEEELDESEKKNLPLDIPIIALRNTVLFPNVVLPITIARNKSTKAIIEAEKSGKWIGVIAQKDVNKEDPTIDDLYRVGTLAKVIKSIKMPDGNTTLFIMGRMRFEIEVFTQEDPFFRARVNYLEDHFPKNDTSFIALMTSIKELGERIAQMSNNIPSEASLILRNIENHSFLIHFVSSNINVILSEKQNLLQENDVRLRAEKLLALMQTEMQMVELKIEITNKTRADIDKQQREYFLHQQMKSIREELGGDPNEREVRDLQKRAESIKFSEAAKEIFQKNIQKLERMHPSTPDYSVVYNHLDLMLDLPWGAYSQDSYDLKKAKKVLDNDHYGMDKIKDRILEYLAVLKLKGDMKSPILCFVGPPGIGKTSLGRSIASAINRMENKCVIIFFMVCIICRL